MIAAALAAGFLYIVKTAPSYITEAQSPGILSAVGLGAIIILAWVMGDLFEKMGLPRMTGYMITGLLFGPYLLNLVTAPMVSTLKFIDHIALTMIALRAGHELKIRLLRTRIKSILIISLFLVGISFIVGFCFVFFGGRIFFPFMKNSPQRTIILVALLFGLIEMAKSPVTTIAILDETKARGPFSETILGVVIVNDVILIILFGLVMSLGSRLVRPEEVKPGFLKETLWGLFGSIGIGAGIGFVVGLLLKRIRKSRYLIMIILSLGITLLARFLHLELLLLSLSAGFVIENFTKQGKDLLSGLEEISPFIYLVFFPVASASLDLSALKHTWHVALLILVLRKLIIFISVWWGSRVSEDFPEMRRYGWMGFINQSGVTLALAIIIGNDFPEFGEAFKALALSIIVITDIYAPAFFKFALHRVGEIPEAKKKNPP